MEITMKEEWKDIVGYEGKYQISNEGRVFSTVNNKIIQSYIDDSGYQRIRLWKNNKCIHKRVHRLVAEAFLENHKKLPEVNHKNCIKHDNRVDNLEWCTHEYNMEDGVNKGVCCPSKKVLDRLEGKIYNSVGEASRATGSTRKTISFACNHCKNSRWSFIYYEN